MFTTGRLHYAFIKLQQRLHPIIQRDMSTTTTTAAASHVSPPSSMSKLAMEMGSSNVTRLTPLITRVMGMNPGTYTLTGTCTYLIGYGNGRRMILIDSGEGLLPSYIEQLRYSLHRLNSTGIAAILLTHRHRDHTGGVVDVLKAFHDDTMPSIPVIKHVTPNESSKMLFVSGKQPQPYVQLMDDDDGDDDNTMLIDVVNAIDGDMVLPADIAEEVGVSITAMYTPGHTSDHTTYILQGGEQDGPAVFTGDCVLGAGTTVFEDLTDYMASLHSLHTITAAKTAYPGHGPVIDDLTSRVDEYIEHRTQRTQQIIDILNDMPNATAWDIVLKLYADYPENLQRAAERAVKVHLIAIEKERAMK